MAMARFRGARHAYLTCFYCGKRSGLRYEGVTRDFLCQHCDATNYLDENGEITDPPVATDVEAPTTQYAAPSPPAPADVVFCQTCLKNQHLFAKSLAQYLPDDTSDPECAQLERNYYRYRRGLESRYPQVCDECADKVEDRIRQAGYTAKTDHLRRMMDLGRGRKSARRRSALYWASSLGKAIWRLGFVLELLWHLVAVAGVLRSMNHGMHDPEDADSPATTLAWLIERTTAAVPAADGLIQWSIMAALASAWWNPHFVQVKRGFTRHLLGFTQWYSFQGLTIFLRLMFRGLHGINVGHSQSPQAQISAHFAMVAVMVLIYVLASKSIRVDTSPLFATSDQVKLCRKTASLAVKSRIRLNTVTERLNDIINSMGETRRQQQRLELTPSPQTAVNPLWPQTDAELSCGNPGLSDTPIQRPRQLQYAEEMDWSPIPPQHRAFNDQPSPGKGDTKIVEKPPFWHRVPAAPVNPAWRLRNPPRVREEKQAAAETNTVAFAGPCQDSPYEKERDEGSSIVEFRQPQFFAPVKDDASSLADLLSQSFSLSQEQDGEEDDGVLDPGVRGQLNSRKTTSSSANGGSTVAGASLSPARRREPLGLALLINTWLLTVFGGGRPDGVRTFAMVIAGIMALRGTGNTSDDMQRNPRPGLAAYALWVLSIAELAAVCWVGCEAWKGLWKGEATDVSWHGVGVLVTMLGRRLLEMRYHRACMV